MYPQVTLSIAADLVAVCHKGCSDCHGGSCTGGLIAGAITSVSGASAVFERGSILIPTWLQMSFWAYLWMTSILTEPSVKPPSGNGRRRAWPHPCTIVAVTGIAGLKRHQDKPVGTVLCGSLREQHRKWPWCWAARSCAS